MEDNGETQAWAPSEVDGDWLEATVVQRREDGTVVLRTKETGAEHTCTAETLYLMNTLPEEGMDDMARLNYLHEPALLNNLRHRFARDHVYTYTAKICIAVNPFNWMVSKPLYAPELLVKYRGREMSDLPPHVYAIAEDAYQQILNADGPNQANQSILVSGESGAGKTESVKIMMNYLAAVSKAGETNKVAEQVLASNPLLEAFGNARTMRNDNSSRFGKFIEIQFGKGYKMSGANIHIYLLEKTRVVQQSQGERNYHVFYQLLAGLSAEERGALHLEPPIETFALVNQSGCITINGVDDAAEFRRTRGAMESVGMDVEQQMAATRSIAVVLLLAQLRFEKDGEEHATIGTPETLQQVSGLLGAEASDVSHALCTRQLVTRDDIITVPLNLEQATDSRDALGKAVYGRLFKWLVDAANVKLVDTNAPDAFIGILDVRGCPLTQCSCPPPPLSSPLPPPSHTTHTHARTPPHPLHPPPPSTPSTLLSPAPPPTSAQLAHSDPHRIAHAATDLWFRVLQGQLV